MGSQLCHLVNDAAVQGRLSHVSWKAANMETRREQAGVEASGRHPLPVPSAFKNWPTCPAMITASPFTTFRTTQ
ncbi:unnamed protein product [Bubo scandiacus]